MADLPARPKLKDIPIIADDLNAVLDVSIRSIKLGRPAKFPETEQGLEDFKQASVDYLEHIREVNNDSENEHHLIPDVEGWATFIGTTRQTILTYETQRNDDWKEFIALVKGSITACKKQLIFRQKIPSVIGIFDLCNNSGYVNSSEYKLIPEPADSKRPVLTASELPILEQPQTEDDQNLPLLGQTDTYSDNADNGNY